jgi:hypothetical protein
MPTYMITGPDGKKYRVSGQGSPEAALGALKKQLGAASAPAQAPASNMPKVGSSFTAATEGLQSGGMFGFDDEIAGLMLSPIEATKNWWQGKGFDLSKAYGDVQRDFDARKGQRRQDFPVSSIAGEVVGGLATAGGAAKAGLTTIGRMGPVTGAALEGGAYGALSGAGEAKPGERLQGAGTGALIGGVTGGVLGGVSKAISNRAASKATEQMRLANPGRTADDLADEATMLYQRAEQANVRIKPQTLQNLTARLELAAGRPNERLRPLTIGIVEDLQAMQGPMTLGGLDEVRQGINKAMDGARGQDLERLMRIKTQFDNFVDGLGPKDITGDMAGFDFVKQARGAWQKKSKTELIDKLLRDAELDTSQYTQSGIANTITKQFRKLAKDEKALRGFTQDEKNAIIEIAMGKYSSRAMRLLAKFAPRGVVSAILGMAPSTVTGPVGLAVPMAGHLAGKAVDKAALNAAREVQAGVSRGFMLPALPAAPGNIRPLIPGASGLAGSMPSRR